MNIEIANRLVELRKKAGLSQEELALSLGVSRQAVSKWERAESSPDTDNLICLAKLYNCSLDELVGIDILKEEPHKEEKQKINIDEDGIYLKKNNKEINVDSMGIHIKDENGKEIHVGSNYYGFAKENLSPEYLKLKKRLRISDLIGFVILLIATITYILIGSIIHIWHPTWIIFLIAIIIMSIIDSIAKRNFHAFLFPILVTTIYLILGFYFKLWHPGWVVFLFIPLYYVIAPKSKKKVIYRNIEGKTVKDYRDPKTVDDVMKICKNSINE